MRFNLIALTVVVALILGCGLSSAYKQKKDELYIHCYSCDSLGVEKTVFARYEPIYFGCIIKNVSNRPIKYKHIGDPLYFFSVAVGKFGSKIPKPLNFKEPWSERELNPNEQLSHISMYPPRFYLEPGLCTAVFYFGLDFGQKHEKTFKRSNREIRFTIEED